MPRRNLRRSARNKPQENVDETTIVISDSDSENESSNAIATDINNEVIDLDKEFSNNLDEALRSAMTGINEVNTFESESVPLSVDSIFENDFHLDYAPSSPNTFEKTETNESSKTSSIVEKIIVKKSIDCPVCLEDSSNKQMYATFCGHIICKECVLQIMKAKNTRRCPQCRKKLNSKLVHPIFI